MRGVLLFPAAVVLLATLAPARSMAQADNDAVARSKIETFDRIERADSKADTDRTPVHTVVPQYPEKAWLERVEGDVEVCFYVTRAGRPYNIRVRQSDNRVFERPARTAVKRSRFKAIPSGEKVPQIKTCRTFLFRLERVDPEQARP